MKYNGDRSKESLVNFAMQHVRSTATELSTGNDFPHLLASQGWFEFTMIVLHLGHNNEELKYLSVLLRKELSLLWFLLTCTLNRLVLFA